MGTLLKVILVTSGIATAGIIARSVLAPTQDQSSPPPISLAPAVATPVDAWAGKEQEATDFVKSFPVTDSMWGRCPSSAQNILDGLDANGEPRKTHEIMSWSPVSTVEDVINCDHFFPGFTVFYMFILEEKKEGAFPGMEETARQLRSDPEKFRQMLETQLATSWTASQQHGAQYDVSVQIKLHQPPPLPREILKRYSWLVNMRDKTIRPKTWGTWVQVDITRASDWGVQNGNKQNDFDVSTIAPVLRGTGL
jgi:hypothetical protein